MCYNRLMEWEIEVTDQFEMWYDDLELADAKAVVQAIESLERTGPALGRPLVDTIDRSRIANLKELRPKRNDIRILFVFDPRRTAILLIGGSKTND
ncbi:MAG: type II toxin-antitoxin system RelE/ParE family toxin [Thermomicrobiales bacterium]